jgi:hypothetical protein
MPYPKAWRNDICELLGGRRFRYYYEDGFISTDVNFVNTGEVYPEENKPEGPWRPWIL